MADVFWNSATPPVAAQDLGRAYLPVRLVGAASDGSQDTFAQAPLPAAGKSAYQSWLDLGNTGSEQDFINSLGGGGGSGGSGAAPRGEWSA